jgi:hypothetical protein
LRPPGGFAFIPMGLPRLGPISLQPWIFSTGPQSCRPSSLCRRRKPQCTPTWRQGIRAWVCMGRQVGRVAVTMTALTSWGIKDMKAFLRTRNIDTRHCLEKSQLVELCQEALEAARPEATAITSKVCGHCGKSRAKVVAEHKKMKVCSRCRSVFYCGVDCQTAHWPTHKNTCGARLSV